jgi:arsenite transporter
VSRLERSQPLLVVAAVVLGTLAGTVEPLQRVGRMTLVPLLIALLTAVFAGVELSAATAVLRDRRVLVASVVVNFVVAPVLAVGLGSVLLSGHPEVALGLLMLLVTPCTDWYLAFTATARGDVPVATGLLPVNLLLQLLLLPGYLWLLGGALVPIDPGAVLGSVAVVVGIPVLLAATVRRLAPAGWRSEVLEPRLGNATVVLLVAAVGAMFAWEGTEVLRRPAVLLALLGPLTLFFLAAFLLAQLLARWLDLPHPQRVTLTMTVMARNSPLALAVAATAFSDRPLVALTLVAAPVVELPVLALAAHALRRRETPVPG